MAPRVAIVGGGLAGTLAALVARSRGLQPTVYDMGRRALGGRALGGRRPDSGLQFLRASDASSQFASVLGMLEREGLVKAWEGRFGILGARGGFLPREVLADTPLKDMMKDGGEGGGSGGGGGLDFCGFLGQAAQPMYVGTPANASICAGVCEAAGVAVELGTQVLRARPTGGGGGGGAGWALSVAAAGDAGAVPHEVEYDALVLASHDASLAAEAVRAIGASGLGPLDGASSAREVDVGDVGARLSALADALEAQRAERSAPLFTWSAYYPAGTSARVPFDAAAVPGSALLDFVCRDASKPGRAELAEADGDEVGGELWTAVSTTDFARAVLGGAPALAEAGESDRGGTAAAAAASAITTEMTRLLTPFFGGDASAVPPPAAAVAKRWAAALPMGTLDLNEDAIGLEPWHLAIAGDFIRAHPSPAEAAALSGLDAGERIASWLAPEPAPPTGGAGGQPQGTPVSRD